MRLSIPGGSNVDSKYIVGLQQKFMDQTNPALYSVFQAIGNGFHIPGQPSTNNPPIGYYAIDFTISYDYFILPYSYIFNSANSSSFIWNGNQVNSYPASSSMEGMHVHYIDEYTTDVFGNNYPSGDWYSDTKCPNDPSCITTINGTTHTGSEQRRIAGLPYSQTEDLKLIISGCTNCGWYQPTVSRLPYNRTLPYTVATDVFLIDNVRNLPLSANVGSGIFIMGVPSTNQPQPKIVYSDAVVGATDAIGIKHDLDGSIHDAISPSVINIDNWNTKGRFAQAASNAQQTAFLLRKVDKVQFENLEINGNIQNHYRKGASTSVGLEFGAQGLSLATKNTTVKHLYIHHMPVDGIAVVAPECAEDANFYGQDITSEYNGRVGLDMGSGRKVRFDNCKFNHQGCALSTVQVNQNNQPLQCEVPFSCGVDLEHEDFCLGTSPTPNGNLPIEEIEFNCCEFNFLNIRYYT